jgi:hypothetical protein
VCCCTLLNGLVLIYTEIISWSYGSWISWQGVLDLTHSHKGGRAWSYGLGSWISWQGVLDLTLCDKVCIIVIFVKKCLSINNNIHYLYINNTV